MSDNKLLPPREVVRMLGISYSTLNAWRRRGIIRAVRMPTGRYRYPMSEVIKILRSMEERNNGRKRA